MPEPRRVRLVTVVGARPNLMKAAPLLRAMRRRADIEPFLVHTGQHYDAAMSDVFFQELGIPAPSVNLGVGSGAQGAQTGQIMQQLEPVLDAIRPDCVVVVGDVNSTMAAALVAAKLRIPVAHVEAGLRSFDRSMPEEINRVVTDTVTDYFFTTSRDADEQLAREGAPADRIFFVGNVMIDTLIDSLPKARTLDAPRWHGLSKGEYAVLTLHRPSSVDDDRTLTRIFSAIREVQTRLPVIFPAHPRTRAQLSKIAEGTLERMPALRVTEPMGYLEFLGLLADARVVLTDSGGIQEETTALGIPCLTLRTNTERPVTIAHGTNRLVGHDPARIVAAVEEVLSTSAPAAPPPELWDGRAGERIVTILMDQLARAGDRQHHSATSSSNPP